MTKTKVTCPKFDGGDGTVYIIVSTDANKITSIIEDIADQQRYAVPTDWLVPYVGA
jgi:glycerate kinase